MFKRYQALGKAIKSVKTNVPQTKKEKLLRDVKILQQQTKASAAKLKQTLFEKQNPEFKGKDFTFKTKTGKTESNKERFKRIQSENTKAIKGMVDEAFKEKKAKGGRIGYRRGTPKRETNIQKIKKTFGPKGLGMQSVIYGLDKNPKITAADPKAKFIAAANKKKKKV